MVWMMAVWHQAVGHRALWQVGLTPLNWVQGVPLWLVWLLVP